MSSSSSSFPAFKLERYFAKHEFTAKYLLCASDCEAFKMSELIEHADEECKELWNNLTLHYTESQGHPLLRQEIVKSMYPSLEHQNQVLLVAPEEGIYLTMRSLLEPNDHVISVSPAYQSLYDIASTMGCNISHWQMPFDLTSLKSLIQPNKTKLLVINFPHNPTGHLPTQEEFREIINFCKQYDIYLFSDEMYRLLEYSTNDTLPPACELYDKAIVLAGMSKTFGLPGIRIGWIATKQDDLYRKIASMKDYTTICPPAPSEILALMGLRQKERIVQRNLKIIQQGIQALEAFFQQYPNEFEFTKPKAGPIAFVKLKSSEEGGRVSVKEYCEKLLLDTGILLLPGEMYDHAYTNYFRVSFGRENIPEIVQIWKHYKENQEKASS